MLSCAIISKGLLQDSHILKAAKMIRPMPWSQAKVPRSSPDCRRSQSRQPSSVILLCLFGATTAYGAGAADARDVLDKLRAFDAVYQAGFTAEGTGVFPGEPGIPARPTEWKMTLHGDTFVLREKATEVPPPDYEKTRVAFGWAGRQLNYSVPGILTRRTIFSGPQLCSSVGFDLTFRPDSEGRIKASARENRHVQLYPPDSDALGLFKMRIMFSLGRGYSRYINELESVSLLEDGAIKCTGTGKWIWNGRWELVVDPAAAYMVRSAKFLPEFPDAPPLDVTTSGVKWFGDRCVPEKSVWVDALSSETKRHINIVCRSARSQADLELISEAEQEASGAYEGRTSVIDRRSITRVKQLEPGAAYTALDQLDFDPLEIITPDDRSKRHSPPATPTTENGNTTAGSNARKEPEPPVRIEPQPRKTLLLGRATAILLLSAVTITVVSYLSLKYYRRRQTRAPEDN